MLRLIPFELKKIWQKRSFALSVCALLIVHLFLLWYTSLPDEETPPLSAYRTIQTELSGKNETEKENYIANLKKTIDGICCLHDILAMQSLNSEMGNILAQQELQNNPGVFESYYDLYQTGGYLKFTGSLELEKVFIDEIYEEQQKVAGYGDYLRSIQENKDTFSKISIFGGQNQNSYSARNLKKSAADYAHLSDENIRFNPSKGITSTMQSKWTDLLLLLGVMLFVGSMITEEKEKKLFFITRSTKHGVFHSIGAKLTALLIHCILLTMLFYMVSLVFFGQNTGWFNPTANLQSLAPYTESSLPVSILGYILISVLTKAFILFGIGTIFTIFCILSGVAALPFLAGLGIIGVSALMYYLIPAGTGLSVFKYINPVGLMKTENLYGRYLNFNLFGYPVSRLALSLALLLAICAAGVSGSIWLFCRMKNFEMRKLHLPFSVPFRPHTNILRHEGYKILITNRSLVILLLFAALLAYNSFDRTYTPSVTEQYYRGIMMELEGKLTEEKEALILSEKARYEEALQTIEHISEMVSSGELSSNAADTLNAQADMTLAFYPAFERVEKQYEYVKNHGGSFVYDTGYLYMFGVLEDTFSIDFLILSIGIILAFSGAVAMEYQTGALFLLCATKTGKRKILFRKFSICIIFAAVIALIPILCRAYNIASVYPMHNFGSSIQTIPHFTKFGVPLSIGLFFLLFVLSQIAAMVLAASVTLALSMWRKNQVQTVFFALLVLVLPVLLKLLGFEIAKWFSLYPLYAWIEIF